MRSSLSSSHVVLSSVSMGVLDHYLDPYSWIDPLTELLQFTKALQLVTCHTVGAELIKFERVHTVITVFLCLVNKNILLMFTVI